MELAAVIWMLLVLKIPVVALLAVVWWAIKQSEPADGEDGEGGSRRPDQPRGPRHPRPPRRGPRHAGPLPAPARVRTAAVGRDAGDRHVPG